MGGCSIWLSYTVENGSRLRYDASLLSMVYRNKVEYPRRKASREHDQDVPLDPEMCCCLLQ